MSRNILLMFSLLVLAFIFSNSDLPFYITGRKIPVGVTFGFTMISFIGYFLARQIFMVVLDWVNRSSTFKHISRIYYTHLTAAAVFSMIGLVLYMLFPHMGRGLLAYYLYPLLTLIFGLYFIRCNKIIISNGFSHFFWILYLCSLEILPLVVLGHVTLS